MGELTSGSQAEFRCGIVERLAAAQQSARLSRRLVREAAAACGVAESTMWRWIACGGPTPRPRRGVVPSERAVELLLAWRGNVAAVHRQLMEEGDDVPSVRTLARAFERGLSPAQLDFARRGDAAVRDRAVYLRHEARFRAECYEGDHKQLSIKVLAPRAQRPQRPWVTLFVDQFSRLIVRVGDVATPEPGGGARRTADGRDRRPRTGSVRRRAGPAQMGSGARVRGRLDRAGDARARV